MVRLGVLSLSVWHLEGQVSASEDLKERPLEGTPPLPSSFQKAHGKAQGIQFHNSFEE